MHARSGVNHSVSQSEKAKSVSSRLAKAFRDLHSSWLMINVGTFVRWNHTTYGVKAIAKCDNTKKKSASRLESIVLKYCIIVLFWNSSMLLLLFPHKSCYYAYIMLRKHLELEEGGTSLWLASFSHHSSSSLLTLMVRMLLSWCFSKFSQLTRPNLFAAMWQFAHAPCYYSGTMLKCFWLAILSSACLALSY